MGNPKFYQVGGSVRDELLGLSSKDVDYAVEADSFDAMRQAILDRGGDIFLETPQYFTIRARVPALGGACDFVLCRIESDYRDGRHPEKVVAGTIYDDLARRDFTINAIAKAEDGTIIDPHNGRKDIQAKLIRCVGDPRDRFTEDGLRVIRAVRFSITKWFDLDESIADCLNNPDFIYTVLKGVSLERVREEMVKCFSYSTSETLDALISYPDLRRWVFKDRGALWLKPTIIYSSGERNED